VTGEAGWFCNSVPVIQNVNAPTQVVAVTVDYRCLVVLSQVMAALPKVKLLGEF
jgi:hypothetical protein